MIAIVVSAYASLVFAQQQGPPPIDKSINPERARQQDMSRREWQLRNPTGQPGPASDRKQLELAMAQTEKDFNRILKLHNEIAHAIAPEQANINFRFVADATEEIGKRAQRLQSTLMLQMPAGQDRNGDKSNTPNYQEMREGLRGLCRLIRSFVTNPVIENPGTVHAEHLEKARKDLASIVKLSNSLSRDAEQLRKR
jgi:hypothetical protein